MEQVYPYEMRGVDIARITGITFSVAEFEAARLTHHARTCIAVDRIHKHHTSIDPVYVGHSGGKDSVMVRHLANLAFGGVSAVVPPGLVPSLHNPKVSGPNTVSLQAMGLLYHQAARGMSLLITTLHPIQYGLGFQIDGTRRSEAERDDGRSTDVIIDGQPVPRTEMPEYVACGIMGLEVCFPIYDWTDAEVWASIHEANITYSTEYVRQP